MMGCCVSIRDAKQEYADSGELVEKNEAIEETKIE